MVSLAIVIPAYNEQATLADVVEDCLAVFAGDERLLEILVVDDRSTDTTAAIAGELGGRDARVRLLANPRQLGCVPTVLRGFEAASADFVFFLPADGQVEPEVALRCLDVAETGADVVVTRRVDRQDPWYRIALSRAYNLMVRALVRGFPASDIDSSCLFRRELAAHPGRWESATAFALVELLLEAQRAGARIDEIEIRHLPRQGGQANGVKLREIRGGLEGLVRLARWRRGTA